MGHKKDNKYSEIIKDKKKRMKEKESISVCASENAVYTNKYYRSPDEIGAMPPYAYTILCPNPNYRRPKI